MVDPDRFERVVARDFTPRGRLVLVALGLVLLSLGLTLHLAAQHAWIDIPRGSEEASDVRYGRATTAVDARFPPPAFLVIGGLVAGAGVAVLLYAFAHPMVRHKRLPYVAVVLAGQLMSGLLSVELITQALPRGEGVRVDLYMMNARAVAPGEFVALATLVSALLAFATFAAWCLLRPEDFEGTRLHRAYLASDAARAKTLESTPSSAGDVFDA